MSNNKSEDFDSFEELKGALYNKIKKQVDFVDCCEQYNFIREFDTINFNNKMNRLKITHLVLDEKYNYTETLQRDIINPIRFDTNTSFGIIGYTGTGKSELAQTISKISKKANLKYKDREVDLYLCWEMPDFYRKLMLLKKGDIFWKDEMPPTIGKGSRVEKWSVESILHVIRKMENTFIFVDPTDIKMDICNLYLESAGMDFKTKTNRFMVLDKSKHYFGHIYTKLHDDKELREWYEKEKDAFIERSIELGARFKADIVDVEFEQEEEDEDLQELRDYIRKHNNRISIKKYASLINQSYKIASRILKGFVSDKKLKVKKEEKGKLIFYL